MGEEEGSKRRKSDDGEGCRKLKRDGYGWVLEWYIDVCLLAKPNGPLFLSFHCYDCKGRVSHHAKVQWTFTVIDFIVLPSV